MRVGGRAHERRARGLARLRTEVQCQHTQWATLRTDVSGVEGNVGDPVSVKARPIGSGPANRIVGL